LYFYPPVTNVDLLPLSISLFLSLSLSLSPLLSSLPAAASRHQGRDSPIVEHYS
jgi:hypothetical protein